jgi:hypothetical protein
MEKNGLSYESNKKGFLDNYSYISITYMYQTCVCLHTYSHDRIIQKSYHEEYLTTESQQHHLVLGSQTEKKTNSLDNLVLRNVLPR